MGRKRPETLVREALDAWGGSVEAMELTLAAVRGRRLPRLPELERELAAAEIPAKGAERLAASLRKDVSDAGGEPALSRLRAGALAAIRKERESAPTRARPGSGTPERAETEAKSASRRR